MPTGIAKTHAKGADDLNTAQMQDWTRNKMERLVAVLPTILFFIALFWCINLAFGSTYTMVVSSYTALFNMRWRKYNAPARYLHIFLLSLILLVLARLATMNLVLCVLLNLTVPLVLVFMRSSQLNPRRYFPYTMLFVFLELRPETFDAPPTELLVILLCCALTTVALVICGRFRHEAARSDVKLHATIRRLADLLDRIAETGIDSRTGADLLAVKDEFSAFAYAANEDSAAPDSTASLFEMFAALAQRTAYLAGNLDWQASGDEPARKAIRTLAQLTRAVEESINPRDNRALIGRIDGLLTAEDRFDESRVRIFYRSYLRMLRFILQEAEAGSRASWHLSTMNRLRIAAFRKRPSLDSFEMRFSVRCGVVLAISCAVKMIFPVDHLYWFALHAFLLLQPYHAESLRRMRTRAFGTVLGCLLVHGISLLSLPYAGVMGICMVFIAGIYTAKPGSVSMAFFATSYAVSLASFSIGDDYATFMRIGCLLLAIALVFAVNRLVCPTSERTLFQTNVRLMFSLIERSWDLVRTSLGGRIEAAVTVEALLHFQMVHLQAVDYANKLDDEDDRAAARRVLFYLWELACEIEQLELLVRTCPLEAADREALDTFAQVAKAHCSPWSFDDEMEGLAQAAGSLGNRDLRYVLGQYLLQSIRLDEALDQAPDMMVEKPAYLERVKDTSPRR